LFAQIRRDCRVDGLSVRALAKRHRVHRRTVRQALISAQPPSPVPRRWRSRRIDPFVGAIDDMLRADRDAPRKQRHTARRILARLIDEHGAADLLSYSTLRDYVAKRRPEIAAETGDQLIEAFVPQTHEPGCEAEVDFAELYVDLPEGRTKCFLFTMRLSMSGKAVHRVYATQSQEAFLEGHLAAFDEFGGIPTGHIRYDNLKSAVSRVLFGDRGRIENQRWVLFRSHQCFEAFYCIPGVAGAHEKGGVEARADAFGATTSSQSPK
jgi:transposase